MVPCASGTQAPTAFNPEHHASSLPLNSTCPGAWVVCSSRSRLWGNAQLNGSELALVEVPLWQTGTANNSG